MIVTKAYSEISPMYSLEYQKTIFRWTLMFPGAGCEYYKNGPGCTICGFSKSTEKYSNGKVWPPWVFKLMYFLANQEIKKTPPDELFIYNGGSFWNDKEIPRHFQNHIYKVVARNKSIKRLMIENRCEYISKQKILRAKEVLGREKRLTIAIGLESSDEYVRNLLIKKALSLKFFEKKAKLIQDLGAELAVYIFLKPSGLSEEGAVIDTLNSISYAVSIGAKEIYLSSAFIQEGTIMADDFIAGKFKPPSLWSVLKIIEETEKNNWPVLIGGFSDSPPPIAIPVNCDLCSTKIYKAIDEYRITRKLGKIPNCSCKSSA